MLNQCSMRREAVAAMSLTLLCSGAAAQSDLTGTLEEVIVTAQKRAESLQDVPLAVSAVSGDKLLEAGINKIGDLASYVPSLRMQETATGNNISIRGIYSGVNNGFEQSVGTYVDGIYHGRSQQSRAPFLDLERVEVLRGSQGILFGKNSVAGALNISSARPTESFEARLTALYEPTYDEQVYSAMVSGPFDERFRGRLAVNYREYDGNIENIFPSRRGDEPQREEAVVRGWLEFDVTSTLELALKAEVGYFDSIGRPYEVVTDLPGAAGRSFMQILRLRGADPSVLNTTADDKRSANADEFSNNDSEEIGFYVDWQLGEHQLTAISGYSAYDIDEQLDGDFTAADLIQQPYTETFDQWSQEIRLASPTGGRFEYLTGLYWERTELSTETRLPFSSSSLLIPILQGFPAPIGPSAAALANTDSPRSFEQETQAYAAFAQGTLNVTDAFRANVGLRWSKEEKEGSRRITITDLSGNPITPGSAQYNAVVTLLGGVLKKLPHDLAGEREEDHVLPAVSLEYDLSDDVMGYASWNRGSKSGGFDANANRAPAQGGVFEFEDESATNYELGVKTSFGGVLELNVAAYFTEFDDLQVSAFDGVAFNVTNAGSSQITGAELDARWQASPQLLLTAALAYTDFEFKKYVGQCYTYQTPDFVDMAARISTCDYQGKTNQYVAPWNASVSGDYRLPIGARFELRTMLDAYYSDDFFTSVDLDPKQKQDSYVKLNARISFGTSDDRWQVALVGKNLTDERIMPYGITVPLANTLTGGNFLDTRTGGFSSWRIVEPGRSVGIEATVKF
jgi:iron complex outermembrane recepter protein